METVLNDIRFALRNLGKSRMFTFIAVLSRWVPSRPLRFSWLQSVCIGVVAYNTAQRTREIGVRMALGAEAKHVVALVASQGGRLIVFGIIVGVAGSAALLRLLSGMLFGASPVDIPVFAGVSFVLAMVAFIATWLPARRAATVSPLEALRAE